MADTEDLKDKTAEGNEGAGAVETQTTEDKKNEGKAFKTFQTEEEYENAVKSILKQKLPPKEEMEAFKTWKENQKTEEQKQSEKEAEYQKTLSQNTSLEQENKVLKSGVNVDDVDYVVFKVSKMEGDFAQNLKSFLKDNPKYLYSNDKDEQKQTIDLGGEHKESSTTDLSKMTYDEYKAYRKKQ